MIFLPPAKVARLYVEQPTGMLPPAPCRNSPSPPRHTYTLLAHIAPNSPAGSVYSLLSSRLASRAQGLSRRPPNAEPPRRLTGSSWPRQQIFKSCSLWSKLHWVHKKWLAYSAQRGACDGPACVRVPCSVRLVRGATHVPAYIRDKPPWMYIVRHVMYNVEAECYGLWCTNHKWTKRRSRRKKGGESMP